MTPVLIALGATVVVMAVLAMFVIGIYNGLVAARNRFKNAYAQIDVQLKRRYDLIPNLVEAVKGYMSHEKGTLEAVIEARNSAFGASKSAADRPGDPSAMQKLSQAEGQLNGALGRLMALSEAYPDLKANQNMMAMQEELVSTENKVGFARQGYNDAVMRYNTHRETFPNIIVSNFLNFGAAQLFEIESEKERQAPRVSFG